MTQYGVGTQHEVWNEVRYESEQRQNNKKKGTYEIGVLTRHRGTASTELEEVGGAGLTWRVMGEGQPSKMKKKSKQKETMKKNNLRGWGVDKGGQKAGTTQQRAPEYLEKKLARRKNKDKSLCRGEAMRA